MLPPLLVVSGEGAKKEVQEFLKEIGVRKFLPKPFTIARLVENVKEALPEIEKPHLTSGRPMALRLRTAGFFEQLAPGLQPIRGRIARNREMEATLRNQISANPNIVVRDVDRRSAGLRTRFRPRLADRRHFSLHARFLCFCYRETAGRCAAQDIGHKRSCRRSAPLSVHNAFRPDRLF